MAVYTQTVLNKDGEANRQRLVDEIKRLEDLNVNVPETLREAAKYKQLSDKMLTASLIELTGRVATLEATVNTLAAQIAVLQAFHP